VFYLKYDTSTFKRQNRKIKSHVHREVNRAADSNSNPTHKLLDIDASNDKYILNIQAVLSIKNWNFGNIPITNNKSIKTDFFLFISRNLMLRFQSACSFIASIYQYFD